MEDKNKFAVEITSFTPIKEIPGSWTNTDYKALLVKMDYENPDEISEAELKEMCFMSITDYEPAEAAKLVLEYLLEENLTDGQIENLSHQMLTEKLWEENPKLDLHVSFFKATQLLFDAYNGKFPRAEAVQFKLKLTAENPESLSIFEENPEAPIVRILAQGMSDHNLVNRLFGDQLEGTSFEEAKNIIWELKTIEKKTNEITFDIVSSAYWLDDIKYADNYEATSHPDILVSEEE
ncbi:hypothetical protein [Dyadobacter frigoris]|uniref:Uncharacterized protein n=1 Tax=Dyadobacter frigoris TaxID=2576211 RepID=A0A4U6D9R2_9BACT|nr:hypothetical protein [Dyadobacter frigoris]TKT92908.1 hypothetical protein FDK13_08980 [Dyadobacter frigoris]GLU54315.1 hypothetical protein Dfri01_37760 [Dyadobacter frigoris]